MRRLLPGLVLGLVAPLLALVASPAGADGSVVVTWPEVTRFNPDLTPYVVHVEDTTPSSGPFYVYATSGDRERQLVPPSGDVEVTWPTSTDHDFALLEACPPGQGCQAISGSPVVSVWSDLDGIPVDRNLGKAGAGPRSVYLYPLPADEDVHAVWRIVDATGVVVAEGESYRTVTPTGSTTVPYVIPGGLEQRATYRVLVDLTADTEDFGDLAGALPPIRFDYDGDADEDVSIPDLRTVYSVQDGYLDDLLVRVRFLHGGMYDAVARIMDPRGKVVRTFRNEAGRSDLLFVDWDGTLGKKPRTAAPAGTYTLRVTGTDPAGNHADVSRTFQVSPRRVVWKRTRFTVSPQASQNDRYVGSCSTLKKLPNDGVGLYSQTRCADPERSAVISAHGAYLPTTIGNPRLSYRNFRVTVTGGGATKAHAYLVLGYIAREGAFRGRAVLDDVQGKHPGTFYNGSLRELVHFDDGRPFMQWQVGLTEGSRYDVRSFTVEVEHRVLR